MEKHIKVPMTREEAKQLKAGDYVYLTGTIYTARDAAHKRMQETLTAVRSDLLGHQGFLPVWI